MVHGASDDWASLDKGRFLAWGAIFTLGVDALLYPLELVKTRVHVEAQSRATLLDASVKSVRDVLRREGVRGLYTGFTLFSVGGLPSQGCVVVASGFCARRGRVRAHTPSLWRTHSRVLEPRTPLLPASACLSPTLLPLPTAPTFTGTNGRGTGSWSVMRAPPSRRGYRSLR